MEKIIKIVSLGVLCLSVLTSVITFVISALRKKSIIGSSKDELTALETKLKRTENIVKIVREIVPSAITFAETSGAVGGELKNTLALSKILIQCGEEGIDFKDNQQLIKDSVEELITLTNRVNVNKISRGD